MNTWEIYRLLKNTYNFIFQVQKKLSELKNENSKSVGSVSAYEIIPVNLNEMLSL